MKSVCIIPARGGSKRIPRKNIRPLLGKPVIAWVIETAMASNCFDEIMVSTDDKEIADVARHHGASIPFMRSPETASDHATTGDVLSEVLLAYTAQGITFDMVCCCYPCAALTRPEHLRQGQRILADNHTLTCVMPVQAFTSPPQRGMRLVDGRLVMLQPEHTRTRTQDLEPVYHDAGQWYWLRTQAVINKTPMLGPDTKGLVISELDAQDVDTLDDWDLLNAKLLVRNQVQNH